MAETASTHIVWHESEVSKEERQAHKHHKSAIIWFTGLSGAGKSTISAALEKRLHDMGIHTYRLDGDNVRHGLNQDLAFSEADRKENIRRIGEVAKLMVDAGLLTLTAFISPYREDRQRVRDLVEADEFIEVYVKASLASCEARDVKGLYEKARQGILKNFTGIDAPYEEPNTAEIVIDTEQLSVDASVVQIVHYLQEHGYISYH